MAGAILRATDGSGSYGGRESGRGVAPRTLLVQRGEIVPRPLVPLPHHPLHAVPAGEEDRRRHRASPRATASGNPSSRARRAEENNPRAIRRGSHVFPSAPGSRRPSPRRASRRVRPARVRANEAERVRRRRLSTAVRAGRFCRRPAGARGEATEKTRTRAPMSREERGFSEPSAREGACQRPACKKKICHAPRPMRRSSVDRAIRGQVERPAGFERPAPTDRTTDQADRAPMNDIGRSAIR